MTTPPTLADIYEAIDRVRDAQADHAPRTIHGRKHDVYDLLLDSGFTVRSPRLGDVTMFSGIDVHYDETMLKGMVELRDGDGEVLSRLMQTGEGRWVWFAVGGKLGSGFTDAPATKAD